MTADKQMVREEDSIETDLKRSVALLNECKWIICSERKKGSAHNLTQSLTKKPMMSVAKALLDL